MDTQTAQRIYNILGGDRWQFDANNQPTTTPTEDPGSSIIQLSRELLSESTQTNLDLTGNLLLALLRAQVEAVAKIGLGVDLGFSFADIILGRELFGRVLTTAELVDKIISILNGLKDLFNIGENGEPPQVKDIQKLLEDIKDCTCFTGNGEYLLGCPGDKERTIVPYSGEGIELIYRQLEGLARIVNQTRNQTCEIDAIAAVPEHWQLRPEAQRPQLVIFYAEKLENGAIGRTRWPLTIPHYTGSRNPKFPDYRKGQWEGILTLRDNSKLIVNASSKYEAERVIRAMKKYINSDYLVNSFVKVGERKGQPLKRVEVTPVTARYFSTGQMDMKPNWMTRFRK
ncbi:hypothetical protein [Leptolyngbya sp. 7M]|uniref:hypothetical protein n=1 Tax=Leptolyngbya sp. 7M TaxID=2812896 RepID=UPI001B8B46E3|nr:hypothetical protein [Leptolyngbya sp. 7M]QYO68198.1 hypothetical protein JVX88_16395 [Leptolyngbya sp. 7M]